jgi:hypothetical protein
MILPFVRVFAILGLGLGLGLLAPAHGLAGELPLDNLGADPAVKKIARAQIETALAADPKNYDLRIKLGALLCDIATDSDDSNSEHASDAALELFKDFYAEAPNDPEVRAFYGSACTIHAEYVFLFFKPGWADKGFAHLDAAVAAAPDNVNVRLIRALNSSEVPSFLGRDKEAREDFAWLLLRRESHPKEFSPVIQRALYFYAGRYALLREEPTCIDLLTKAAAIPGESPLNPKIQTALLQARAKFSAPLNPPTLASHHA